MTATDHTTPVTSDQRLPRFYRGFGVSQRRPKIVPGLLLLMAMPLAATILANCLVHNQAHAQTASPPLQTSQITTTLAATSTLTSTVTAPASVTSPVSPTMSGGSWIEGLLPSDPDETRKIVLTAVLTVLGTLFVVFFRRIAAMTGKSADWVWRHLKVERAIDSRYRKKLANELRSIQILSMPEAKSLETFYVPLRLVGWLEPDLRDSATVAASTPIHIDEAINQFPRITILGLPGAGKTTITSHVTAAVAERRLRINDKEYFPIYVLLRRLRDFLESENHQSKSLLQLASEQLALHGYPEPERLLEKKLAAGECLLVLDGFDEIADREGKLQLRLANKVRDFVESSNTGNRVVLTSRSAGFEAAWFNGFQVLEMTELSVDQAKQFIGGWYGETRQAQAQELQQVVDRNQRLQLLVSNPLMLAIICFVYSTRQPGEKFLPRRRVDLYDRCIETLIARWDKSRGVTRDALFKPEEIETVLSHVAYDALRQERIDFSRLSLLASIRTHLPKSGRRQYEDEAFLKEVLQHTGLFKHKGRDTIGFIHLTFQEYLAGQVIQSKVLEGVETKDLAAHIQEILTNAINPAWREPIALASGMMRGRTELIDALYAVYRARPSQELEGLLALCLRDADLDDYTLDPDHMVRRDEIIANLVGRATEAIA